MTEITEEQLKKEREVKKYVHLFMNKKMSKKESNDNVKRILKEGYDKELFTKKDLSNFKFRRDMTGGRTYVEFGVNLIKKEKKGKKAFLKYVDYLKKKGILIKWESLGTNDEVEIMIASFGDRKEQPTEPDYRILVKGKRMGKEIEEWKKIEVKAPDTVHPLKIDNLEKYKTEKAAILVDNYNSLVLYSPKCIRYLLSKVKRKGNKLRGKDCLKISPLGKRYSNCDAHLDDLVKSKLVRIIERKN